MINKNKKIVWFQIDTVREKGDLIGESNIEGGGLSLDS